MLLINYYISRLSLLVCWIHNVFLVTQLITIITIIDKLIRTSRCLFIQTLLCRYKYISPAIFHPRFVLLSRRHSFWTTLLPDFLNYKCSTCIVLYDIIYYNYKYYSMTVSALNFLNFFHLAMRSADNGWTWRHTEEEEGQYVELTVSART